MSKKRRKEGQPRRKSEKPVRSPRVAEPSASPRPPWRFGEGGWRFAIVVSVILAAMIPVFTLAQLWPFVSEVPVWDQWSTIEVWSAHYGDRPVLPLLLAPYNGHYNLLPRFIYYGLGLLTHWNLHTEAMLCYFGAAGILLLLLRILWETRPRFLVLAAPMAAYVFSIAQYNNFVYGYPFGQWLGQLAAMMAIYLLTRAWLSRRAFFGALACGLVASFSYAATMAVWPVGGLVLLVRRPRVSWPRVAAWGALSAGGFGLALSGVGTSGATIVWSVVVPFTLGILGHPLTIGIAPSHRSAEILGGLLLAAFGAFVFARWRKAPADPLLLRWGGFGLMAITSAVMIAAGRSSAGLAQSLAPHYVTASAPLVLALLVFTFDGLERIATADEPGITRRPALAALAGLLAAFLIVAAVVQPITSGIRIVPVLSGWMAQAQANDQRILAGVATDAEIRKTHHPLPRYVRSGLRTIRRYGLAWFGSDRSQSPTPP